jgi:hypothetical protein
VTIQYDIHHAAAHRHRSANLLRAPARRRLETKNESTWHIHWRYLCKKKKTTCYIVSEPWCGTNERVGNDNRIDEEI